MTEIPEDRSSFEPDPLLTAYCATLTREHDFISHRMGWLMTLNGFLVAGSALLAANIDKFTAEDSLRWAILAVSVLGVASNASCLYSNYWAMRAIEEAGTVLYREWGETRTNKVERMRLYGRDPKSFKEGIDKSPFTKWLHPWFLLPATFIVAYTALPIFALIIPGPFSSSKLMFIAPAIGIVLVFSVAIWRDLKGSKKDLVKDPKRDSYGTEEESPEGAMP